MIFVLGMAVKHVKVVGKAVIKRGKPHLFEVQHFFFCRAFGNRKSTDIAMDFIQAINIVENLIMLRHMGFKRPDEKKSCQGEHQGQKDHLPDGKNRDQRAGP